MSGFAVRNDGQGWRAVDGEADLLVDEWYTEGIPPAPVQLPPTVEELTVSVKAKRDLLLSAVSNRIGPFQDAVDLDEATADEMIMLRKLKQYRIALNRIDQQSTFPVNIVWPESPE